MAEQAGKRLKGRRCYGHLGGKLGERLLESFIELGWLKLEEGKTTVYEITEKGCEEFEKLGINYNERCEKK